MTLGIYARALIVWRLWDTKREIFVADASGDFDFNTEDDAKKSLKDHWIDFKDIGTDVAYLKPVRVIMSFEV